MMRMIRMMRMMRTLTIATLAACLCVAPGAPVWAAPAAGEAEYVRDVVGRAAAHVEAGRYDQALAVLDEAERERPLPVFVYVRATVEERRGDCERAMGLYRDFLAHEVPEADAEDARRGQARCRRELGLPPHNAPAEQDPGTDDPRTDGSGTEGDRDPGADVEPPAPRRWYADPLGGALAGAGVVGLGVGVGLYVRSRADARAADEATSLQTFDDRAQRAVLLDRAGIATMAVGGALLVAGAVRYAVVGTRGRRRMAIVPAPTHRGTIVRLTAWF
jgi:hypothetical protein